MRISDGLPSPSFILSDGIHISFTDTTIEQTIAKHVICPVFVNILSTQTLRSFLQNNYNVPKHIKVCNQSLYYIVVKSTQVNLH